MAILCMVHHLLRHSLTANDRNTWQKMSTSDHTNIIFKFVVCALRYAHAFSDYLFHYVCSASHGCICDIVIACEMITNRNASMDSILIFHSKEKKIIWMSTANSMEKNAQLHEWRAFANVSIECPLQNFPCVLLEIIATRDARGKRSKRECENTSNYTRESYQIYLARVIDQTMGFFLYFYARWRSNHIE